MKNLIFVLLGIVIGVSFMLLYQTEKPEFGVLTPTDSQKAYYESAKEQLRKNPNVSNGQGVRISENDSKRNIRDFKKTQKIIEPVLQSVGLIISTSYSFGLSEIDSLLEDIKILNQLPKYQGDNQLSGIRIHLGENTLEATDDNGNTTEIYYVDAFITPVNKKGRHIFVDDAISYNDVPDPNTIRAISTLDVGNSGSLNASNPCPDVCP